MSALDQIRAARGSLSYDTYRARLLGQVLDEEDPAWPCDKAWYTLTIDNLIRDIMEADAADAADALLAEVLAPPPLKIKVPRAPQPNAWVEFNKRVGAILTATVADPPFAKLSPLSACAVDRARALQKVFPAIVANPVHLRDFCATLAGLKRGERYNGRADRYAWTKDDIIQRALCYTGIVRISEATFAVPEIYQSALQLARNQTWRA
jgi:hypothetical protein